MDVYEVQISVIDDDGDYRFYVDHRFAEYPEVETLVMLRGEAAGTFELLHPEVEIKGVSVSVVRLSGTVREDNEPREHVGV